MTPMPILILFANLKGNLGDFAILHAMLVELEKRYPGSEKHVVSHGHRAVDEARLAAFCARSHPPFIYKGRAPFKRVSKALSMLKRVGLERWLAGKLVGRFRHEFAKEFPVAAAGDYEAIFIAGGEQWSGSANGICMLAVLCAVSEINPNVFMFPFSVKRKLLESYSQDLLKSCFSRISGKLVVRDSHSGEIMKTICPGVVTGADCVFSLAGMTSDLPAVQQDGKVVMIAVTEANGSRYRDLLGTIKSLIAGGYRVRLLTSCEREDGRDMLMLSRTLGVEYVAPLTWQDVVTEFRSAALVVTNRLHCMIFAFFADAPLIPLLNREKVGGVFRDTGLPYALSHASELTPEKVAEWTKDGERIRCKMRTYLEKVRKSDLNP